MGTLIHTAMQISLHRDPKYLPGMSVLGAELRRRLWATILEMELQTSLNTSMPVRIVIDDFDTEPPSNVDNEEIDEMTTELESHLRNTFTMTSLQLLLLDTMLTRLRIPQLPNHLHSKFSYPDVLALSRELTDAHQTYSKFALGN